MLLQLLVVVLVPLSALCAYRISIIIVCLQCNKYPTRVYLFSPVENTRPTSYRDISRYMGGIYRALYIAPVKYRALI